ncbi:quinone oxidoreductase family protein [Actinacidiphila rubida]|uniref:quinone oxidoreductase family protein n=1 Tax=Actinacidiphila rubida TaxID=310780 RepID=UPI0008498FD0|nr:zinc-binding dehydrogenase [Actinacidiphila rubida]
MRAIQITEFGGPEVLRVAELPEPVAGPGQVLVDVRRAGVNYADTHTVEDSYLSRSSLPMVPGAEVAGRTGDGRRIVALTDNGGYAERAVVHEAMAHDVPEGVSDEQALALVVQGVTAWHLLRTSAPEGLKERLVEANGGRKVDVVLEMTGGPVFDASLAALAPFGRLVTYGMASRVPATAVRAEALMGRSRAVVGFWLAHCLGRPGMYREPLAELLALTADGSLKPQVGAVYPLEEAARAHADLRARRTVGKLALDTTR